MLIFKLDDDFVQGFSRQIPDFGFNGLGLLTYYRTYSRLLPNGENEQWYQTVRRVVEGCYSLQKEHILHNELGWNDQKAQRSAQEMYTRMFQMKFLPPGRMIWALGTPIIHERKIGQALFNCAFVSTEEIGKSLKDAVKPFLFMFDMSMTGCGVGWDPDGAELINIHTPAGKPEKFVIPDSREGWVESLDKLLSSYFGKHFGTKSNPVEFDYSLIRPAGVPLKGFGGISSGPSALVKLHEQLKEILNLANGKKITITNIADIMNMIGQCVVAGGIRRTAQVSLGPVDSEEYRKLKDYRWNAKTGKYEGSMAHRSAWGWASNNSVFVDNNSDFTEVGAQTGINGEPGYAFLNNMREFSRMCDPRDYKDAKAKGANPCMEQTLFSWELCCLQETFPSRAESKEDFIRTLKFAYLMGKTATLATTTWKETNRVQKKNRRIGTSVTGVTDFLEKHSLETLRTWLDDGYKEIQKWDEVYSSWLGIPRSIKTTSVKPSGSVSLLAGVNPGCHFPEFEYYIRRVRVSKLSPLIPPIKAAGLHIEEDVIDDSSFVVEFPIHNKGKNLSQVSLWEQVALAAFMQRWWADNQVSCLTGDTFIRTSRGLMRMDKLPLEMELSSQPGVHEYKGDLRVLTAEDSWISPSHLIINEPKPIRKISTEGGQSIRGTFDHKIQIIGNNRSIEWRKFGDIQEGDYVVEKINQPIYQSTNQLLSRRLDSFKYEEKTSSNREATIPKTMTEDLAEFLGYLVSDGCVLSGGGGFNLTQQGNNVIPRFVELVKKLFNLECSIDRDTRSKDLFRISVSNRKVAAWLKWIGVYDENRKKRVPWPVLSSGYNAIKSFLMGITLDGHISKPNGRITIMSTNSLKMTEELSQLLKIIGYQASVYLANKPKENVKFPYGIYSSGPCWAISLSPEQSARFYRMVGFAEDRKTEDYKAFGNKARRSLFGGVPDLGFRKQMREISKKTRSAFLTDHFHSASCHFGKEVSRETLLQMRDLGATDIPDWMVDDSFSFRKVISVSDEREEVTYDITVPESHTYIANGFVSHNCTATFLPHEASQIPIILDYYKHDLKSISFLPKVELGAYAQMPYEAITRERYEKLMTKIKPIKFTEVGEDAQVERYCDGDKCVI